MAAAKGEKKSGVPTAVAQIELDAKKLVASLNFAVDTVKQVSISCSLVK
jgi:hypothetical protein